MPTALFGKFDPENHCRDEKQHDKAVCEGKTWFHAILSRGELELFRKKPRWCAASTRGPERRTDCFVD